MLQERSLLESREIQQRVQAAEGTGIGMLGLRLHVLSQTEGKTEDANSKEIQHRVKQWFSTAADFVITGGRKAWQVMLVSRGCC